MAHSARADRLEDLVGADRAADETAVWLHLTHVGHYDAAIRSSDPGVTFVHMNCLGYSEV